MSKIQVCLRPSSSWSSTASSAACVHESQKARPLLELSARDPAPDPRGAVRMRLATRRAVLDLNGPIRCQVIGQSDVQHVIDRLGPDVLDPNANALVHGLNAEKLIPNIKERMAKRRK